MTSPIQNSEQAAGGPCYQVLDTYQADLLNEYTPRREEVTEMQDREAGELLCYANPDKATFIVTACNSHAALVEALERALAIRNPNVKWTRKETARSWIAWEDQARAALRLAQT